MLHPVLVKTHPSVQMLPECLRDKTNSLSNWVLDNNKDMQVSLFPVKKMLL